MTVDKIIEIAKSYKGIPWVHQGRTKHGVDCAGFLSCVFKDAGFEVKDEVAYSRFPDGKRLKELLDNQPSIQEVPIDDIQPGDIALFRIKKLPQHLALITQGSYGLNMIHAYNGGSKQVVEHNFADFWKQRLVALYRIK